MHNGCGSPSRPAPPRPPGTVSVFAVCLCGDTAPRYKRSLDACDVPCSGDSRFICGGNESNWYLSVVRLLQTSQSPNASRRRRTLADDDKSEGAPLATKNVEKDTGKDTVAAKEKIVATPVQNKVIEEEPKSTYKGCFAVKENPGLLTTHVNCNLEMSNKVRGATTLAPAAKYFAGRNRASLQKNVYCSCMITRKF